MFLFKSTANFRKHFIFCKFSDEKPKTTAATEHKHLTMALLRFRAKIHENVFMYAAKLSLFENQSHQFSNESNCMCDNHKWWLCVNMQFVECENPTFVWWFNIEKKNSKGKKSLFYDRMQSNQSLSFSFGSDISNGVNHISMYTTKTFSSYLGDVTTKNHDTYRGGEKTILDFAVFLKLDYINQFHCTFSTCPMVLSLFLFGSNKFDLSFSFSLFRLTN